MDVEVVRPVDVETRSNHSFTHDWPNVRAATISRDCMRANACQQFPDLTQIRTRLTRRYRGEAQTFGPVNSGIRFNRQNVFSKIGAMSIAVTIAATQSVFFVCVEHDSNRAPRTKPELLK